MELELTATDDSVSQISDDPQNQKICNFTPIKSQKEREGAGTKMQGQRRWSSRWTPLITLRADRPFYFQIVDVQADFVLLSGAVIHPGVSESSA
jgi:hypothetical protein